MRYDSKTVGGGEFKKLSEGLHIVQAVRPIDKNGDYLLTSSNGNFQMNVEFVCLDDSSEYGETTRQYISLSEKAFQPTFLGSYVKSAQGTDELVVGPDDYEPDITNLSEIDIEHFYDAIHLRPFVAPVIHDTFNGKTNAKFDVFNGMRALTDDEVATVVATVKKRGVPAMLEGADLGVFWSLYLSAPDAGSRKAEPAKTTQKAAKPAVDDEVPF